MHVEPFSTILAVTTQKCEMELGYVWNYLQIFILNKAFHFLN